MQLMPTIIIKFRVFSIVPPYIWNCRHEWLKCIALSAYMKYVFKQYACCENIYVVF